MPNSHYVVSTVWENTFKLPFVNKFVYLYLLTNSACRPSGLYTLRPETLEIYTGCSKEDLKPLINTFIEYDFETCEVWVKEKIMNLRNLDKNRTLMASIKNDREAIRSHSLRAAFDFAFGSFLSEAQVAIGGGLVGAKWPPGGPLRHKHKHEQYQKQEHEEKKEHERKEKQPEPKRWDYPPEIQALVRSAIPKLSRKPLEEKKDEKVP